MAPLPLLGAHMQTAVGSALTVVFVGFETRPRGKQREFLPRRKAARWLSADSDWHGEPERENGGGDGGLPELCFRQCQAPGPAVLWSLSQGRGSVERVLAGRPSGSASERASSFEILWRRGLWKKSRKGKVSERTGEDWTEEHKRAPRPGDLPLCLSKAGSPGTGCAFGSHSATPRPQAGMQETPASRKETKPSPKTKAARHPTHRRPRHYPAACFHPSGGAARATSHRGCAQVSLHDDASGREPGFPGLTRAKAVLAVTRGKGKESEGSRSEAQTRNA